MIAERPDQARFSAWEGTGSGGFNPTVLL